MYKKRPESPASGEIRGESVDGQVVTYEFTVTYPGDGPEVETLPVDITAPVNQRYIDATLAPSRLERRGRVVSYDTITPRRTRLRVSQLRARF